MNDAVITPTFLAMRKPCQKLLLKRFSFLGSMASWKAVLPGFQQMFQHIRRRGIPECDPAIPDMKNVQPCGPDLIFNVSDIFWKIKSDFF